MDHCCLVPHRVLRVTYANAYTSISIWWICFVRFTLVLWASHEILGSVSYVLCQYHWSVRYLFVWLYGDTTYPSIVKQVFKHIFYVSYRNIAEASRVASWGTDRSINLGLKQDTTGLFVHQISWRCVLWCGGSRLKFPVLIRDPSRVPTSVCRRWWHR